MLNIEQQPLCIIIFPDDERIPYGNPVPVQILLPQGAFRLPLDLVIGEIRPAAPDQFLCGAVKIGFQRVEMLRIIHGGGGHVDILITVRYVHEIFDIVGTVGQFVDNDVEVTG